MILTISRMEAEKKANPGYRAFLANGFNVTRTLVLFFYEVCLEWIAAARGIRRDIRPRGHRGGKYPFLRAGLAVVVRDLTVYSLLGDMMKGRPAVYACFAGYDEVAHHSGLERADTLEVLRKLDQQFGRIARARRYAARPYEIVVLSDHGQTQGATFKQRNGYGLDDLVQRLARAAWSAGLRGGDENDSAGRPGAPRRRPAARRASGAKNDVAGDGHRARFGQPGAHLPHGRAAPPDSRGDRRAASPACSRRCARTRTSAGCSSARPSTAPWRSAPAAPTT